MHTDVRLAGRGGDSPTLARTPTSGEPRADLEALIENSPVRVAIFDAGTGDPVSFNQEARRAVGPEVALDRFPLSQQLSTPETVRAEEIVLSVPDGRRVKTLVNAAPIRFRRS